LSFEIRHFFVVRHTIFLPTAYSLLLIGRLNEFERGLADNFFYRSAADALRAHADRFPRAICRAYMDPLEIRLELPPGNAGHLRAYAAKVLCLAAMSD
jgi:hypothetical protein